MPSTSPAGSKDRRAIVRRRLLAGAVVVVALSIGVPIAWASHLFTDVPDGHQFHDDIASMQYAGITSGKTCVPPGTPQTYCPTEEVNRQAMAAFLTRGFSRTAFNRTVFTANLTAANSTLAVITIEIGGVAGRHQTVKLDGVVTTSVQATTGCPCASQYFITQDGVGTVTDAYPITNDAVAPAGATGPVTAVVWVPTGTTQTFRLVARRPVDPFTGNVLARGALSAITGAFGSTGGE